MPDPHLQRLLATPPEDAAVRMRAARGASTIGLFERDVAAGSWRMCAQARRIWDLTADEPITDRRLAERIPPEDRARAGYLFVPRASADRVEDTVEHGIVRRDASRRRILVEVHRMGASDPGGHDAARIVGTMIDVTEDAVDRRLLEAADANQRLAMELGPQIPWTADPEGRFIDCSERWLALTGLTDAEARASGCLDATHPDDRAAIAAAGQRSRAVGAPYSVEHRLRTADGRYRWVRSQAQPQCDASGAIVRWYGTTEDIDERKRARDALRESEQRYRLALATPDVILACCDAELRYTWIHHDRAEFSDAPMLGRTDVEIADNPGTRALMALKRRVLAGAGGATGIRESLSFPMKGGERSFEIVLLPVTDPADHAVTGVATAALDVTTQKRAQRQLARSAETFRALIRNNPFGVYVLDADLKLVDVSRGAVPAFGSVPPVPGLDFTEGVRRLWPEPFGTEVLGHFRHTLESGEPYQATSLSRSLEDGMALRAYDWRIDRIDLPDGRHGIACYFYDLSERRELEVRLQEADRRKDRFLATLSHELRNPLTPIRNAAHLLSSSQVGPAQLRWASAVIQRQVSHMAWLLDDLLDLTRITQDKLSLRKSPVALASVIDTAVETVRPMIDAKRQHLHVDLPCRGLVFEADPLRLAQVISNLLTNASKYSDEGGRIELATTVGDERLEIRVSDDGIGIAADSLTTVFEMFAQVDQFAGRADGGLGIGLALVKGLVALHGGTVEARSPGRGRGSCFIVRLPRLPTAADPGTTAVAPAGSDHRPPAAKCRRLLVVDDSRDAADSLAMLMQAEGHEVSVAYDGRDALAIAAQWRPEFVLLDIGMPGLDGYATAKALRALPGGTSFRLVALTGWGQEADKQAARDAGFDLHLTKPADLATLQRLLGADEAAPWQTEPDDAALGQRHRPLPIGGPRSL